MDSVAETALQIAIANGNAIFPDSNKKKYQVFRRHSHVTKTIGL
jgi:hypothetical protein